MLFSYISNIMCCHKIEYNHFKEIIHLIEFFITAVFYLSFDHQRTTRADCYIKKTVLESRLGALTGGSYAFNKATYVLRNYKIFLPATILCCCNIVCHRCMVDNLTINNNRSRNNDGSWRKKRSDAGSVRGQ